MKDFFRQNLNDNKTEIEGLGKESILKLLDEAKGVEVYWKIDTVQEMRFYDTELQSYDSGFNYTVRNSDKSWTKMREIMIRNIMNGHIFIDDNVLTVRQIETQKEEPKKTWTKKRKDKKAKN